MGKSNFFSRTYFEFEFKTRKDFGISDTHAFNSRSLSMRNEDRWNEHFLLPAIFHTLSSRHFDTTYPQNSKLIINHQDHEP